jgi:hypothetical protein
MDINKAMQICLKNKVKVYPEYFSKLKSFKITYTVNGKTKYFDKLIKQKDINNAIVNSYLFLASKL